MVRVSFTGKYLFLLIVRKLPEIRPILFSGLSVRNALDTDFCEWQFVATVQRVVVLFMDYCAQHVEVVRRFVRSSVGSFFGAKIGV